MNQSQVKVLVIGSGAAGLNAALQVYKSGVTDILILTEGLDHGTSINTGSDKQTYYKLSLCGSQQDSPERMAESYLAGGSMHGDLALVESALSARAFNHLVELGIPFPQDRYGQFVGYKTDHDPLQRATSIGPYTSREMCKALSKAVGATDIWVREKCEVVELLTDEVDGKPQAAGAIYLNEDDQLEVVHAGYVIFAVGGPGGIYQDSVYPAIHSGAIGLALLAGAKARNLPDSQFGLAATKFRWNVSGTYLQVLPSVISVDEAGNEEEFLLNEFSSPNKCYSQLFLKGYQWPFDVTKAIEGSSRIDVLIENERKQRNRRVFLDYRLNPVGLDFHQLSEEVFDYLEKSDALFGTPYDRLLQMNPKAVELFRTHGIDLATQPLEVAVCAQHNNGGLAGDIWWESENVRFLFPVGEVNGSHGVKRPGGSALNSGQVGGFRAAEKIAYYDRKQERNAFTSNFDEQAALFVDWESRGSTASITWQEVLAQLQSIMSRSAGFVREQQSVTNALHELKQLWRKVETEGMRSSSGERKALYRTRHLLFAGLCYLGSICFSIESGVGSRGSAMVVNISIAGVSKLVPENEKFREMVLETYYSNGELHHEWQPCRPLPHVDHWFEREWAAYQQGEIYSD